MRDYERNVDPYTTNRTYEDGSEVVYSARRPDSNRHEPAKEKGIGRTIATVLVTTVALWGANKGCEAIGEDEKFPSLACDGQQTFVLSQGQGYADAINRIDLGEGVYEGDVSKRLEEINGTNIPRAGVVYQAPSACHYEG